MVADKVIFGNRVTYYLVDKAIYTNELKRAGNTINSGTFANEGVVAGQSLEIDFTEDKLIAIEDLVSRLNTLCDRLSEICNNETLLLNFFNQSFNLLNQG